MRRIAISDVRNRSKFLALQPKNKNVKYYMEASTRCIASRNPVEITRFLETGLTMNEDIPTYVFTELFDALVETGNKACIDKIAPLMENSVGRTRTAKETQTLIRRRLGRWRSKIVNPIEKSMEELNSALQFRPVNTVTNSYNSANSTAPDSSVVESAIRVYENMLEALNTINACDRVLSNYNNLSKRFNLEKLFRENVYVNGVMDTVIELCKFVDTYHMPTYAKFNSVIETAWFGLESYYTEEYSKSEILETAIDYFSFKTDGISSCKSILEATMFFDKNEDMGDIDIITEEEPEDEKPSDDIEDIVRSHCIGNVCESNKEKDYSEFEKIFNKYKREELSKSDKPHTKIKSLVDKLYRSSVEGIVEDTPKLLSWIRGFFIVGLCTIPTIGPVLMVIGYIADKIISLHMEREDTKKMLNCFRQEIKKSKTKLKSTEDNETKEKLKKYIKSLEEAYDKIDEYNNKLLTDEEISKKYDDMYASGDLDDDDDENDDDFDFDFDLDDEDISSDMLECASVKRTAVITEHLMKGIMSDYNHINDTTMYTIVSHLNDEDLTNIAIIASEYPSIFCADALKRGIKHEHTSIRRGNIKFTSSFAKIVRLSALDAALESFENVYNESAEMDTMTIYEAEVRMQNAYNSFKAINMIIDSISEKNNPLLEASITNSLKMASVKLRKSIQSLKDKDKQISKNIDMSVNNMAKGVERAVSNDNREAIIKGSVLPSASKIIKLALANAGLLVLGQPVIAVIGTLGYLGVSSKLKAKERQMIIDEIEIELKMCEKYLEIAERKNDMKATRQLLMIQRDLQRQLQRIKYKMKVELGQKYFDSSRVDNPN